MDGERYDGVVDSVDDCLACQAKANAAAAVSRRTLLRAGIGALLAQGLIAQTVAAQLPGALPPGYSEKVVYKHDLPAVDLNGWEVTAVEVTLPAGNPAPRPPHRHPGFVIGYVLEGRMRFAVAGQPEVVLSAGEFFFESPSVVHSKAASASDSAPARLLAFVFGKKGAPFILPA